MLEPSLGAPEKEMTTSSFEVGHGKIVMKLHLPRCIGNFRAPFTTSTCTHVTPFSKLRIRKDTTKHIDNRAPYALVFGFWGKSIHDFVEHTSHLIRPSDMSDLPMGVKWMLSSKTFLENGFSSLHITKDLYYPQQVITLVNPSLTGRS